MYWFGNISFLYLWTRNILCIYLRTIWWQICQGPHQKPSPLFFNVEDTLHFSQYSPLVSWTYPPITQYSTTFFPHFLNVKVIEMGSEKHTPQILTAYAISKVSLYDFFIEKTPMTPKHVILPNNLDDHKCIKCL